MQSTPPAVRADTASNSPTHQQSRYVDILGVWRKVTLRVSPSFWRMLVASGMLERASLSLGIVSESVNVAFRAGSSQQGKARRASRASNCVLPIHFFAPVASSYCER